MDTEPREVTKPSALRCIHCPFQNLRVRKVLTALRVPLGLVCLAVLIPFIKPEWFVAGLVVSLVGETIQVWSFAALAKQKTLAANGPYALVRNPMYIGRFLLMLGGVMLTGYWPLMVAFSIGYYLYALNRVRREEVTLREVFGQPYEDYCATTNRFLPSLRGLRHGNLLYGRWSLLVKNHGPLNLVLTLVAWALLYWLTFIHPIAWPT